MVRVDHEVLVDRPPEVVYEHLARSIADEAAGAALPVPTGRWDGVEVNLARPPSRLTTTRREPGLDVRTTRRIEPHGTGSRVLWQVTARPLGPARLLTPAVGPVLRRRLRSLGADVRRRLERQGTDTTIGEVPCHVATPTGDGPWPGVVVVHDALGMTTDLRRQTRWLADHGYLAVAPDLYHRGGRIRCMFAAMRALTAGEGPAFDDLDTVRRGLLERPDCTGRVGILGFCMGGGYALALAPTGQYDVASANYGVADEQVLARLEDACPIVASYGGRDRSLPGAAADLDERLTRLAIEHDVVEYAEAGHGFCNDHLPDEVPRWASLPARYSNTAYDEPAAADARRRIVAFFATTLGAPA